MINNKVSNRHNWLIYLTKYLKQLGLEAIHLAVMGENLELLKLLITQGANIDCTDNVNEYLQFCFFAFFNVVHIDWTYCTHHCCLPGIFRRGKVSPMQWSKNRNPDYLSTKHTYCYWGSSYYYFFVFISLQFSLEWRHCTALCSRNIHEIGGWWWSTV